MLLESIQKILKRLQSLTDLALEVLEFPMASIDLVASEDRGQADSIGVDHEISPVHHQEEPTIIGPDDSGSNSDQPTRMLDGGAGAFRFAHDFVIHNPTIISQIINSGDIGLKILGEKRMVGAEVDSSARKYSPRCHPETRKSLRACVIEWMAADRSYDLSEERRELVPRMLWIMGPAGVGKSAVAQTIAEKMKNEGRLGAALFFSRPNRRDDPDQVIPTLSHQLAVKLPKYKLILNQRLANDPTILEKTLRVQFKELIIDPFTIMARDISLRRNPLLIILDGLDECKDEEAQCEFIELIAEHVRSVHEFPLLWMVCSRPEWHFRYLQFRPDFPATCRREWMTIDDPEAKQDVAIFLREEFALIRRRFSDYLPPNWPPSDVLQIIIIKTSGLFALATTITRFVGDKIIHDPKYQLQICVDCFNGLSEHAGPFEMLDMLYREICSTIPAPHLPITKRILGVCVFYSDSTSLSAQQLANFLSLEQPKFDLPLQKLHSVLKVPIGIEAEQSGIQFYHASFQEFLRQTERSGQYALHEEEVHYDVATQALQWHTHLEQPEPEPTWSDGTAVQELRLSLAKFSSLVTWKACSKVTGTDAHGLLGILYNFNFTNLSGKLDGFPQFLLWLLSLDPSSRSLIHLQTHGCPRQHSIHWISLLHDIEDIQLRFADLAPTTLCFHVGSGVRCCEFRVRLDSGTDPNPNQEKQTGIGSSPTGKRSSQKQRLHPLLENSSKPELLYDVRLPPTKVGSRRRIITPEEFSDQAVSPRASSMTIVHKYLPWSIHVKPSGYSQSRGTQYVTVWDVLNAIHSSLRATIAQRDYDNLGGGSKYQNRVKQAYENRYKLHGQDSSEYQAEKLGGVRRVDFLVEYVKFMGLTPNDVNGEYMLHTDS